MIKKFITYLNPIAQFGKKRYSFIFPFLTTFTTIVLLEAYVYLILKNPEAVGLYAIFIFIALIIYFAFHDGVVGGVTTTILTLAYYLYIIYSHHYVGSQFTSGVETTGTLGFLYIFISGVIGWLRQTIDTLIEREADEKRRLQAVIQQLPVGVIITDASGRLVTANKQLESILGLKMPVGFQVGKDTLPENKIDGKPIVPTQSPLARALTLEKSVVGREILFEKKGGKKMFLQISSSPIHNRHHKVIAAASIITDITAQKEMEKRKDDFVNMASHELKTPITSMKLYLDSLSIFIKKYNDEKVIKIVNSSKNQIERLQELVNDLLDVSRLQTGKLTFKKELMRLDTLVEETIEDLQATTAKKRIIFTKKTPAMVQADRFRIYQVLTNLLTNALKYSKETDVQVSIKKVAEKVIVSIHDQGIGIAKDQQKKIFERLYQVTDDTEKTFPGFGMGLYISEQIITRHRGKIWVESEKGKGSTFFFSLPFTKK